MIALGFAFVAGVLTFLAPCTLPLIPLVLGESVGSSWRRATGIAIGFGATFITLAVLLASALAAAGLTTSLLRLGAAVVLGVAGLALAWAPVGRFVEARLSPLQALAPARRPGSGLAGGLLMGSAIGLLWAPCVGPIMAAVIAAAAIDGPTPLGLATATAYVAGAAIPLLVVAAIGRRATSGSSKAAARARRGFGVAMALTAVLVLTGLDVGLTARLTAAFPDLSSALFANEEAPGVDGDQGAAGASGAPAIDSVALEDLGAAPELTGITAWINSPPTTLAALRGKVVLVHFWTFGCINCQHVQPYVKAWYDRYASDGFVVIGVHTPELSYERDLGNVRSAVASEDVRFPVAFDPDYRTWNAYRNRYWPAFYFVDRQGRIRHVHFGEGDYDGSEAVIQALLRES